MLLAAAGLKLFGLNVQPVAQHSVLLHPVVQFAAVEWEIVLGLWLLSGRGAAGAWCATVVTFLVFAGVSFHLGIIGEVSCGCFGSVKASPWHVFVVDLVVLSLLALSRPSIQELSQWSGGQWRVAIARCSGIALAAVALSVGLVGVASVVFGSPEAALARFRRELVAVRPGIVDLGSGQEGEELAAVVEIANQTSHPVTIIGGTSDCSCAVTADLPLTLAPGEVRQVSIRVRLPGPAGYFNRQAWFWTDCDLAPKVYFGLVGRVKPPRQDEAATVAN